MRALSAALLTLGLIGTLVVAAPAPAHAAPAETCGTDLRPADRERIVELSTYEQDSKDLPLVQLRRNVDKLYGIVDILTDRRDRRGLFALGLAAVERDAVMPLQNNPRVFQTPRWAPVISLELLNRFLDAVRGEFGGGPVAPQWRHYFDMADDCAVPGQRVAMAGYNAWPFAAEYGISWFDRAPVLAGYQVSTLFLILAVIAAGIAVWQHLRLDYVENKGLTHVTDGPAQTTADRRRLFLASSPIAVIAALMVKPVM